MPEESNVEIWATAISKHSDNGRKIFFRFAKDFRAWFRRASQPDRIIIVWKYESETGQPETEEYARMNFLEDSVESILRQDNFSTLALVSTGENLREWIYYAKSEDKFFARFNAALAGLPAFPIDIHTAHDPRWLTYEEFRSGLREE